MRGYSREMRKALDAARTSEDNFRVGAVVVDKKGKIQATAINRMSKTHPLQAYFARQAKNGNKIYLHAEVAALVSCRATPHTIYVGRLLKDDTPGLSKPCEVCSLAIREAGVAYVVYIDSEGNEVKEEVK